VRVSFEEAAARVKAGELPLCPKCGRALKPAITFFGESLPINALREATGEAQEADLMLVLGTSLTVHPAASLPEYTLRRGAEIVIVNNMPTPLDRRAALRFDELEDTFEGLDKLLNMGGSS
jgi:NAD-dependent deacetylase